MSDFEFNHNSEYGADPEEQQETHQTADVHMEQGSAAPENSEFHNYGAVNENPNREPDFPRNDERGMPYEAPRGQAGYYGEAQGYASQRSNQPEYPGHDQRQQYYASGDSGRTYRYQNGTYQRTEPAGRKPQKNPKARLIVVIAMIAVLCLLLGGVVGGLVFGKSTANSASVLPESPAEIESSKEFSSEETDEADAPKDGDVKETAFIPKTIEVTTNASGAKLSPQDVYENYVNAVVAISNEGTATNVFGQSVATASSGSGFILSKDGYIVTNNHVVDSAQKLTVMLTSGEEYEATVIGADADNDVALIKIEAEDLPTVSIGDSDGISVGEQVCAIGNPLGELTNTLTVGYISALDREIRESSTTVINMFQTDCAINSGNSGGPLFDMDGNVIGITTAKPSSAASAATVEGIGFCIPVNDAMDIVDDLLQYGYVTGRASLGITCQTISSTVTQYYNLPTGVYIAGINEGSAAENAGLQKGDIIISLGDVETQTVSALKLELKNHTAGEEVTLHIYRSGEELDVDVVLDEQKDTVSSTVPTPENGSDNQNGGNNQGGGQFSYGVNPFYGFNPFG